MTALAAAAALVAGTAAPRAEAITPAQTTEWGVVNTIGFNLSTGAALSGSIDNFWARTLPGWGYTYYRPAISFYGGAYGNYTTGCDPTWQWPNNGFYCSNDGRIYLDYPFHNANVTRYGDYYSGNFLAHEWGHRIQHHLGLWYLRQGFRSEYHADCLAGMYTHYGYATGRLAGSDYGEGYNWLYYQPSSVSHGTGANRAAWYQYGYTQYSLAACNRVFSTTAAASAAAAGEARVAGEPTAAARLARPPALRAPDLTPAGGAALPRGLQQEGPPAGAADRRGTKGLPAAVGAIG